MERRSERASGVVLHVSSLASPGGVGDMGPAAVRFLDFLAAAKQKIWQVLPLGPTGYGDSPYSALSAFAGNPLYISASELVRVGWLRAEEMQHLPIAGGPADFDAARRLKLPLLQEAAERFLSGADAAERERFHTFKRANKDWLPGYAQFAVLRRRFGGESWHAWPQEYARRDDSAMAAFKKECAPELAVEEVLQYFFQRQWDSLREYGAERGIRIMGDAAIFVNYDSADVWGQPGLFELDENLQPERVAGVPPDYFSKTGQRWGNPLYRWDVMAAEKYAWWVRRVKRNLALCDVVRLDHFRGFEAYWAVPAAEKTAINGEWVKAPGRELLRRLKTALKGLPLVAEDLGVITPEVDALREEFGLPGMRVLQFGFGAGGGREHLPHSYERNMVVYSGTHDNDTTLGWWRKADEATRANVQTYLQKVEHEGDAVWAMMRAAARSVADTCIFPLQDVLFLGSEARMNTPGVSAGNWRWRHEPEALHPDIAAQLAELMRLTERG
jgi:4-alpha-glucanotransferase